MAGTEEKRDVGPQREIEESICASNRERSCDGRASIRWFCTSTGFLARRHEDPYIDD
jgi:hypothetical protein